MSKKTLVLGASPNPERYSHKAITKLKEYGHAVEAIGKREGMVAGISIRKDRPAFSGIDTVTLYLNAENQKEYYHYLLSLQPKRIIFNPGAENPELKQKAEEKGIETIEACTLVLLSIGKF